MDSDDWQENLGGEEVPDFHEDFEIMRELSDDDEDVRDRLDAIEAHCGMIAEGRYADVIKRIKDDQGDHAVMELVFAIERSLGWHMEITNTKADVEDYLFSHHGIYDSKAWLKAKNTEAWTEASMDVVYASLRRRKDIINEAFGLPVDARRDSLRKLAYKAWKRLDSFLM